MKKLTKIFQLLTVFIICVNCSVNKNTRPAAEVEQGDQLFAETFNSVNPPDVVNVVPEQVIDLETSKVEISEAPVKSGRTADIYKNDPGIYEVKRGDTWMIISQKLLGNPLKWRLIQGMNKEFKKSSDLYVGAKLTYNPPEKPVVEPDGLPYLIKNADTLPKISSKVYGTKNSWDVIYFNNREIIKSPDVIYSGFIIYYPEAEKVPMVKIKMAEMNFLVNRPRKPASIKFKK